jgi:hypothetical protein
MPRGYAEVCVDRSQGRTPRAPRWRGWALRGAGRRARITAALAATGAVVTLGVIGIAGWQIVTGLTVPGEPAAIAKALGAEPPARSPAAPPAHHAVRVAVAPSLAPQSLLSPAPSWPGYTSSALPSPRRTPRPSPSRRASPTPRPASPTPSPSQSSSPSPTPSATPTPSPTSPSPTPSPSET